MSSFTPVSALVGGALIGLAASWLYLSLGRVAGISGIFAGVLRGSPQRPDGAPNDDDGGFRIYFIGGLLLSGLIARFVYPAALPAATPSLVMAGAAGLLVGFGTRLGNGCTSGHGVCGLSRLSKRSLVATLTFIATGVLTVAVVRALGGSQ